MLDWHWVERGIRRLYERAAGGVAFGGAWIWGGGGGARRWNAGVAVGVTAIAGIALAATIVISSRSGSLKSPWSRRKRKHALTREHWNTFFTTEGRLHDGGVKFLKKVRSGGIDPSIRAEVWPFLLGVKEYEKLRRQCQRLLNLENIGDKVLKEIVEESCVDSPSFTEGPDFLCSEQLFSARESLCSEQGSPLDCTSKESLQEETSASNLTVVEGDNESGIIHRDASASAEETESSDVESSLEGPDGESSDGDPQLTNIASVKEKFSQTNRTAEDFVTWRRIIRLDAVRANAEWISYAPAQAKIPKDKALKSAVAVGLKDYDHLETCRIYHAARLVAVLEAYALYDQEIGYCQGMSDLLSPILAVMEHDHDAFWCFVGFMKKARHNFRLDEVGIRRQLSIVSKIIKSKDSHLYRHLEKLEAEDCFFVYRMVVVVFRRELTFEQTLCLWEVMWADQAAIRSGIGKSAWGSIRLRIPPTDNLLLYAIAAAVLQRRKLIIEKYSSMDEILRECNSMAGQLDVWKLLDDAHDLVVTLNEKIE